MTPGSTKKYDLVWPPGTDPLEIEFYMIQHGGKFKGKTGEKGHGLFYHYREAQKLIWPDEDHNRWSDLILETIINERITVIQGCKDSGKTHGMSKFALVDYWAYPDTTLILMSSTDIRGLELRVWGDIKDLFNRAKDKYPWLTGNVVDAKHGIFTDSLGEDAEVRDMRKGIICIPCIGGNGEWVGLQKYVGIKQKRRRLLGDECFPAGTMVDTIRGPRSIETILPGDRVLSAIGFMPVLATSFRDALRIYEIKTKDGRIVRCTGNHQFLTKNGWKRAFELNEKHYILGFNECLQELYKTNPQQARVQHEMLVCVDENTSGSKASLHTTATIECEHQSEAENEHQQPNETKGVPGESEQSFEGHRSSPESSWRKWDRTNKSGTSTYEDVSGWSMELWCQDGSLERQRLSSGLQGGFGVSEIEASNRSRRSVPQQLGQSESEGFKERSFFNGSWVESVTILQQAYTGFPLTGADSRRCRVYNLQVAGHPSYSVNGLICHNCQFLRPAYMDSLSNLDKGDFKGAFAGNPLGQGDPLDKMAEPEKGWDSLGEVTKTTTWKNKFGGTTINLVGIDSPNFDEPRGTKPKYDYLIAPEDADRVAQRWGKDSVQYFSQIMGVRKANLNAHRVITRDLCLKFGAFDDVIWSGKDITKVYGIDASYGGDRCVGGYCEYGEDVNNVTVLKVHPPVIIPILVKAAEIPEDQIATYVRSHCENLGIPPENVYYDSTGRGSLGTSFGRLWSSAVNPVEFGGNPTSRPVCHDLYILDDRTKERRLKRCDEHYSKRVTEYWFSVRYVVESRQLRTMPQDVLDEFAMREWTMVKGDKVEIETKTDCKERMGCSPDLADWLAICVEGARRLGFRIERLTAPDGVEKDMFWLQSALDKHRSFVRKTELSYQ